MTEDVIPTGCCGICVMYDAHKLVDI